MAVPDTITPSSNSPITTLPSATVAKRPTRSPSKDRISSQNRIDEILATGRRRSVVLQSGQTPIMADSLRRTSEHDNNPFEESSADESTSIIRRENSKAGDYHSTKAALKAKNVQTPARSEDRSQGSERASGNSQTELHEPWWKKQIMKMGAVELENKGSVARDHLALERTFLAWLRTSLAFASIGIAITQLFRLNTTINTGGDTTDPYFNLRQVGKPLGATFLGISILVLFIGFHRYFESQHWVIQGKFPASRGSIALISLVAFLLMVACLIVVLAVQPDVFEKK